MLEDGPPQNITTQVSETCKYFNHLGMQRLNSGDPKKAVEANKLFLQIYSFLKKWQGVEIQGMLGLTLNNLSCSYKRIGNIDEAQKCLRKAMDLQERVKPELESEKFESSPRNYIAQDSNRLFSHSPKQLKTNENGLTELNLCAIHSQKGDHMKAKMYAHSAIYKLKQDLEYHTAKQEKGTQKVDEDDDSIREKQSLLAIAYYNLGCQQEHLKEYQKSMESYKNAVFLEKQKSSDINNQLLIEFIKSFKQMQKKSKLLSKSKLIEKTQQPSFTGLTRQELDAKSVTTQRKEPSFKAYSNGIHTHGKTSAASGGFSAQFRKPNAAIESLARLSKPSVQSVKQAKKRPMSAKNPLLLNRLNKNEQSLPLLVGDDIINIQNQIIDEEKEVEAVSVERLDDAAMEYAVRTLPEKKVKKARPVSSYVNKKTDREKLSLYDRTSYKPQALAQHEALSSYSTSNMHFPMTVGVPLANSDIEKLSKVDTSSAKFDRFIRQEEHAVQSSTAVMLSRPPKHLPKIMQQAQATSKPLPIRHGAKKGQASCEPASAPRPKLPRPLHQSASNFGFAKPPSRGRKLVPKRAKMAKTDGAQFNQVTKQNTDLDCSEGSRLFQYVDRNYEDIIKASQKTKTHRSNLADGGVGYLYEQEIIKQMDVLKNNEKLEKDITNFSKGGARILNGLKKSSQRPQTAKILKNKKSSDNIGQITDLKSQNAKSPHNQIRYSMSRSRSKSMKKLGITKIRPKSAYPVIIENKNPGKKIDNAVYFTEYEDKQTKLKKSRVQSAGVKRTVGEHNKPMRPQNRPMRCIDNSTPGPYLNEINEGSDDAETQMLYVRATITNHQQSVKKPIELSSKHNSIKVIDKEVKPQHQKQITMDIGQIGSPPTEVRKTGKFAQMDADYSSSFAEKQKDNKPYNTQKVNSQKIKEVKMKNFKQNNQYKNTFETNNGVSIGSKAQKSEKSNQYVSFEARNQFPSIASNKSKKSSLKSKKTTIVPFEDYVRPSRAQQVVNLQSNFSSIESRKSSISASRKKRQEKKQILTKVKVALVGQIVSKKIEIKMKQLYDDLSPTERKGKPISDDGSSDAGEQRFDEQMYQKHKKEANQKNKLLQHEFEERQKVKENIVNHQIQKLSQEILMQKFQGEMKHKVVTKNEDGREITEPSSPDILLQNKLQLQRKQEQKEEKNRIAKIEMQQQKQELLENQQVQAKTKINENFFKLKDEGVEKLNQVLNCECLDIHLPITADDIEEMDDARADMIAQNFEKHYLQVDISPYKSSHYGKCQLVFILKPLQHLIEVLVFKPTYESIGNPSNARVNRCISLKVFGINKILLFDNDGLNFCGREETISDSSIDRPNILEEHENNEDKLYQERWRVAMSAVEAIRKLKGQLTGDIYKDFFHMGEVCDELGENKNKKVIVNLLSREQLKKLQQDELIQKFQKGFFQSTAYLQGLMGDNKDQEGSDSDQALEISGNNPIKLLMLDYLQTQKNNKNAREHTYRQYMVIYRCIVRFKTRLAKHRNQQMKQGWVKLSSYDQMFKVKMVSILDRSTQKKDIPSYEMYCHVNIKINADESLIVIEAFDLDIEKPRRVPIERLEHVPRDARQLYIIKQNIQFIQQHLICIVRDFKHPRKFMIDGLTDDIISSSVFAMGLFLQDVDIRNIQMKNNEKVVLQRVNCVSFSPELFLNDRDQEYGSPKESITYQQKRPDGLQIKARTSLAKEKLARKSIGSSAKKGRRQLDSSPSKYQTLFENRDQLIKAQNKFMGHVWRKKDDDMGRNKITNQYDYAIVKIQKWWKRKQFYTAVTSKVIQNQTKAQNDKEHIQNIQLQLRILKSDQQDQVGGGGEGFVEAKKKQSEMGLIKVIQTMWRLRKTARKMRKRAAERTGGNTLVYETVKEVFEDANDVDPYNYRVTVYPGAQALQFKIQMFLNNKHEMATQDQELLWDLADLAPKEKDDDDESEQEDEREKRMRADERRRLRKVGMQEYFRSLIADRLQFVPYTPEELEAFEAEAKSLGMAKLLSFSVFDSLRGQTANEKKQNLGRYSLVFEKEASLAKSKSFANELSEAAHKSTARLNLASNEPSQEVLKYRSSQEDINEKNQYQSIDSKQDDLNQNSEFSEN